MPFERSKKPQKTRTTTFPRCTQNQECFWTAECSECPVCKQTKQHMVAILHTTDEHIDVHYICKMCYDRLFAIALSKGVLMVCPSCEQSVAGVIFVDCQDKNILAEAIIHGVDLTDDQPYQPPKKRILTN